MKKKLFPAVLFISTVLSFTILNGCSDERSHEKHMENSETGETNKFVPDSSIIRVAGFKVESADENNNGKVYQCPMDYEIISDQNANCPVCKMNLEEFSVEDAQINFNKYMNQ